MRVLRWLLLLVVCCAVGVGAAYGLAVGGVAVNRFALWLCPQGQLAGIVCFAPWVNALESSLIGLLCACAAGLLISSGYFAAPYRKLTVASGLFGLLSASVFWLEVRGPGLPVLVGTLSGGIIAVTLLRRLQRSGGGRSYVSHPIA